jgi:excisionase family DNA binding protein
MPWEITSLRLRDADPAMGRERKDTMPEAVALSKLQYSRKEAAADLRISLRTLDRLIANKQITVRRIGRRVFITREALEQFIKRDHNTGGVQ